MELFSIKLPLIKEYSPLLKILTEQIRKQKRSLKDGDIVVLAEKVIATAQGRVIKLSEVSPWNHETILPRRRKLYWYRRQFQELSTHKRSKDAHEDYLN